MPDVRSQLDQLVAGARSRRRLLRQAGLAAFAIGTGAGIAGCSTGGSAGPSTSAPPSGAPSTSGAPSPSSSSSPGPSTSSSPSPSASASQAPPQGITVATADVPEGGGVVVQEKYVVTQPKAGEFKAYSAICTHQGCPVDKVENAEIVCPCHASHFAIDTGDPVSGPANEPLPSVELTMSGDSLILPE